MNRRSFLSRVASLSSFPALACSVQDRSILYLGGADSLDVFAIEQGRCKRIQSHPSRRPLSLSLHPRRQFLFAANDVDEYLSLPTGSVESYAVAADGRLTLLDRQALSLSATRPRHVAVTPNGNHLLVPVYGGGSYNLLPVSKTGHLGRVAQTVKEIGCGADCVRQASAHPHSIAFHLDGQFIFGTDFGSDRINVFGMENGRMKLISRHETKPGSGPGHMAIHPSCTVMFVLSELTPMLSSYRVKPYGDLELLAVKSIDGGRDLLLHPSGSFLYTCSSQSLNAWQINPQNGCLSVIDKLEGASTRSAAVSNDGRSIYFVRGDTAATLAQVNVDPNTGRFGRMLNLHSIEAANGAALLSL